MRARRSLVGWTMAAAVSILQAGTASGDFALTGSQHLDVTTSHNLGALYNTSTAVVLAGGYITDAYVNDQAVLHIQRPGGALGAGRVYGTGEIVLLDGTVTSMNAYDAGLLTIAGGSAFGVRAEDTSRVAISGGVIGPRLDAYESSRVTVTGGNVNWLVGHDACRFTISGGKVANLATPFLAHTVAVSVTGGRVENLTADGPSVVDISGGTVDSLTVRKTSTVTLYGWDFAASGGVSLVEFDVVGGVPQYEVVGTGVLTGKWFGEETPWSMDIAQNEATASIMAIPEPGTLGLLALGGLAMLRRP